MLYEDQNIKKLIEVLNEDGTVLFIGSGTSAWSGLPNWNGLIKELAEFIDQEGYRYEHVIEEASKNLLMAAGLGVQQLTRQQFKTFMRQACRVGEAKTHEIHKKITELGPRCFITTNYDKLLEEALRLYKNDFSFQLVTNRQPTDCVTIVQIRERDFIFKPHGDIDDTDSIVLTHEQYRKLYGERKHTLKTLETILLTRPVVFLGYSLNDPDFLYIKDSLENTFKGGGPPHYAIMADIDEDKKKCLRSSLGITVISYTTVKLKEGKRDHSPLLNLLDLLNSKNNENVDKSDDSMHLKVNNNMDDSEVLSILRYASGIAFNLRPTEILNFLLMRS